MFRENRSRNVSAKAPLESVRAATMARQIARTLADVHRHGLLHRDVKPSNVLLTEVTDEVKITDFGLVKFTEDLEGHTRTDQIVGTPSYMAPEQANGAASAKNAFVTDVYGVGADALSHADGTSALRGAHPRRNAEAGPRG